MACLSEANAGREDCNGDPISPEEVDAYLKNMKCGKARDTTTSTPNSWKKSGTKSEEMATNISDANYLGKEPPQELGDYKKSRHP